MKRIDDLRAWRAGSPDTSGPEADAAALFASVEDPPPLSPPAVARIRAGVRSRTASTGAVRVPRPRRWSVAFAALLLGASVATATGTTLVWRVVSRRTAAQPARMDEPRPAPPRRAPRSSGPLRGRAMSDPALDVVAVPPPVLLAPPPALAASPSAAGPDLAAPAVSHGAEGPASRALVPRASGHPPLAGVDQPRRLPARGLAPPVLPGAGDLTEAPPSETRLLGEAMRLNREGDAAGALRRLDRYAEVYPAGVLANEARRVRLAALLRGGDRRAALALVDSPASFEGPGPDLLLVRAELRADAHRCVEALPDFERALDTASDDATRERSAFGRAVCLARAGQPDRAHEALVAYRVRFPHGRFSAEVARLLGETAGHSSP